MNIEEARKHLKKNLNNWKKSKKDNGYMPEIIEEINTDYEAIETLLTAYEKEKEANRKLDKEAQGYFEELVGDDSMNIRRIQELEAELEKEKEKNKRLRNCHLQYEEMTGIDLLLN